MENNLQDNFKPIFKYYKQKALKPCFENVVDIYKCSLKNVCLKGISVPSIFALELKNIKHWQFYEYSKIPGLYFVPNPFTDIGKTLWIRRCLEEYCSEPHKTNLQDNDQTIWTDSCSILNSTQKDKLLCNADQLKVLKTCPIWKLRWATLGLHHDWNSKVYSKSQSSKFPSELNALAEVFARSVGFENYKSQAAIVNFYHVGSTLSPHTDESEEDLSKPLVSISFGLPAIFLIGGADKSCVPTPFFLRSGDVLIMSGESRLAYHAVPRILESEIDSCRSDPIEIFKAHSRININVRQYQ